VDSLRKTKLFIPSYLHNLRSDVNIFRIDQNRKVNCRTLSLMREEFGSFVSYVASTLCINLKTNIKLRKKVIKISQCFIGCFFR